jgi:hypothetical protein
LREKFETILIASKELEVMTKRIGKTETKPSALAAPLSTYSERTERLRIVLRFMTIVVVAVLHSEKPAAWIAQLKSIFPMPP